MRPLKFESCLSVPNELWLDNNVTRLRPDVADGATNSTDSSPDSAPTAPTDLRIISVHIFPQWPEWATTERRLTRQRFEPPRTSRGFSRLCPVSPDSWFGLIRGSAPKTLNFLKFSGRAPDQPRITKNHPDSPRTCYGSPRTTQTLLRLTPTHDS